MPDAPPFRFRHGVASFDPTSTAVIVWTRVDPPARSATLRVSTDPALEHLVHEECVPLSSDRDGTVAVDVTELEPATTYWYGFEVQGQRSPVGRTRTLPGIGAEQLRVALVSCARYSVAPLGVYRAVATEDVDLVVHLGDYIYEDDGSTGPRRHDPPHDAVTLEDYRRRLAQIRSDPDAQALHLAHPVVAVWDDHDLADNAWRTGAKAHDPDEHGAWDDRVRAAARARSEWLPSRPLDRPDDRITWRELEAGDLATMLLLDARWAGRDRHAGDAGTLPRDHPDRSLLGDDQRRWAHGRLEAAPQPWAVLASSVVVSPIALPWPRVLRRFGRMLPNGYAATDDGIVHDDQWDGYLAEREALAAVLARRGADGRRTVVCSGDVHSSWAFDGPCDRDGRAVAVEATPPAVSSAAMARAHHPGLSHLLNRAARQLDHVRWAEGTRRGYSVLEVTRRHVTASWWFVDPWSRDPAGGAELAHRTTSWRAAWPPRWEQAAPAPPRERRPLPTLPGRPDDLARLRTRRRARIAAALLAAAGAAIGVAALGWRLRRSAAGGRG